MLLELGLCLLVFPAALSAPPRERCTTGKNKLLLVSFDGFRWDYDRDVDTPNLDRMAEEGVKAAYMTPPFLTITSPSHFTLLTGKNSNSSFCFKIGMFYTYRFYLYSELQIHY